MGSNEEWDAEKMFQLYVHDYMKKKNVQTAAEIFAKEANVGNNPVVIDVPGGFLSEWWSIFSDQYNATASMVKPPIEAKAAGPSSSRKGKKPAKFSKSVPPVARHGLVQQRGHRFPSPAELNMMMGQPENPAMPSMMHDQEQSGVQFPSPAGISKVMGPSSNPAMLAVMLEEEHHRQNTNIEQSLKTLDVDKMNLSNSSAFRPGSSDQQEFQKPQQQEPITDLRPGVSQGKEVDGDSNAFSVRKPVLPSAESDAAMNKGANWVPMG